MGGLPLQWRSELKRGEDDPEDDERAPRLDVMRPGITSFLRCLKRFLREAIRPVGYGWNFRHEPEIVAGHDRAAEANADQLLRELLGDSYIELAQQGHVDVQSAQYPSRFYRLRMGQPIEVYEDGGRQARRLCVVAGEHVPAEDEFLMKLLWLRTDEKCLLAIANPVR